MTLQFEGSRYTAADFVTANINRVGDNLVITIDKNLNDGISDKVTIEQRLRYRSQHRNGQRCIHHQYRIWSLWQLYPRDR